MRSILLAAVALATTGFACGSPPPDQQPVVLWERGVVSPRFPVVPEAAWEPVHQHLRRRLEPGVAPGDLLACYSVADATTAVAFYAGVYGVAPGALEWHTIPAEAWSAQRRALAAELARNLPDHGPPPFVRRAELPQRGDLPSLILESPRLDAGTGEVAEGALVCLRWSAEAR